jgi:hypothetical protein
MRSSAGRQKRIFSYEEAALLLPEVRRLTEGALRRLEALGARFTEDGLLMDERTHAHDSPPSEEKRGTGPEVQGIVNSWAQAVEDLGLEVKGLWLVDFDSGSGYYCWRWPEEGLQYFHTYEEGFRGRMRIH